ncbi:MAG TPA: hypothetical protein VHS99_08845 [Chloroflexota bacterium]|nr:hypothetical protein [Chloroflexota bacterium]
MDAEWPASPWSSSAPESYVLLHFHRKPSAKAALKLAVLELLARRRLRLLELRTRGRWRRRHTVLLPGDGAEGGAPLGAALEPLWEVYRSRRPKTFRGIPLSGEADGDGGSPKVAGAPEQRVVGVETCCGVWPTATASWGAWWTRPRSGPSPSPVWPGPPCC